MEFMEFLEALVNAQSEDERMVLVKDHAESFNMQKESGDAGTGLEEELAKANEQIAALKQEIKERFFGKFKEKTEESESEESESEESESEETEPTLSDLGFGQKQY